jgi:hypothetical protein
MLHRPTKFQWLLARSGLTTTRDGPIPQVQYGRLSHEAFVSLVEQSPAEDSDREQNAGCSGEPSLPPLPFECFSESLEIGVTRAAGSQMVEPLIRFGEGHLVRSNFFESVGSWAADTLGVREILEQTTAKHIEDAPLVSPGICLAVQNRLPLLSSILPDANIHPAGFSPVSSAFCVSPREE